MQLKKAIIPFFHITYIHENVIEKLARLVFIIVRNTG